MLYFHITVPRGYQVVLSKPLPCCDYVAFPRDPHGSEGHIDVSAWLISNCIKYELQCSVYSYKSNQ